ncbi:MAG: type I glyceraldehyde-3-phosphate dehydrogenase, partial [Candidatus Marinimicrobia bacterium]|nr:type I glyceraldehyde-3-phosphate dehydrogenase [Candidatus Neomarinimicrobiota bacterium]
MRIAINGFGRIGRSVFRILNSRQDIKIVAINDIATNAALAYLLKYDTVMRRFDDTVNTEGDMMLTSHQQVKMLAIYDPADLPWQELGVDVVVEA